MTEKSFFARGENNFLFNFDWNLANHTPLIVLGVIAALLLGVVAGTDIFKGRRIHNTTNLALLVLSIAGMFVVATDIKAHLIGAAISIALVFFLAIVGAFKEGDMKLYMAMAFFFSQATVFLIFASFFMILLYALPLSVPLIREQKKSGKWKDKGKRLGTPPGGPGIALAVPFTLFMMGLDASWALGMLGIGVVVVLGFMASFGSLDKALSASKIDYVEYSKQNGLPYWNSKLKSEVVWDKDTETEVPIKGKKEISLEEA